VAINYFEKNPLFIQWKKKWDVLVQTLLKSRGRPAEVARRIGVSRASMHRWLVQRAKVPAWAFWAISAYVKQREGW